MTFRSRVMSKNPCSAREGLSFVEDHNAVCPFSFTESTPAPAFNSSLTTSNCPEAAEDKSALIPSVTTSSTYPRPSVVSIPAHRVPRDLVDERGGAASYSGSRSSLPNVEVLDHPKCSRVNGDRARGNDHTSSFALMSVGFSESRDRTSPDWPVAC